MKNYVKFAAEWIDKTVKDKPIKVRAEVFATGKEHAASKLLCDTRYQIGLMLAYQKEIADGTLSKVLSWQPPSSNKPLDHDAKEPAQVS